jgi:methionyl-tRNA synthetase
MLKFKNFKNFCDKLNIITTPIFYVNANPHIGHLYTAIYADAIKQTFLLQNKKAILTTGTDEHGLKILQKAKENKMDVKAFCDKNSNKFKELFDLVKIKYDDYIRTTEDRHFNEVHRFWNDLYLKGKIIKSFFFLHKVITQDIIVLVMKALYLKKI